MRVASLLASSTEMLCLLGAAEDLVAISHECDYPLQILDRPRVTRTRIDAAQSSGQIDDQVRRLLAAGEPLYEVDAAALSELAPDLIVTQAQCDVCAVDYDDVVALVERTPALRPARVVALNPRSLADVLADLQSLGEATGRPQQAEQAVAELQNRIGLIEARSQSLPAEARPRVACLEWLDPPMLAGNWTPELVRLAGGVQPLLADGRHSETTSWESIVRYDPQVVIVMPCGFDLERARREAALLPGIAGWSSLSAVQAGRVFAVDGNALFNRSGPRLVDSLELLAGLLHPRLFPLPPHSAGRAWQALAT